MSLGQLLIFWIVWKESVVLNLLKSFEYHWASIIIPEKCLETSVPKCWALTVLLQGFVWILSLLLSGSLLPGVRGSFDLGQMHMYLLFPQHNGRFAFATQHS